MAMVLAPIIIISGAFISVVTGAISTLIFSPISVVFKTVLYRDLKSREKVVADASGLL